MLFHFKSIGLFFILFWCINTCVYAQGLNFKNYNTTNGLPSAQVYHMYQDPSGDIWFASDRGIAKYDGYVFETFEQKDGLTSNTVFKFYPQNNGSIWCSTVNNSLFYFYPGSHVFESYEFNDTLQKYAQNYLAEDIYFDQSKNLYISFQDIFGYLIIDNKGCLTYQSLQIKHVEDSIDVVFNIDPQGEVFTYFNSSQTKNDRSFDSSYVLSPEFGEMGYKKVELVNDKLLFSADRNLTISDYSGNLTDFVFQKRIIGLGSYDSNHFWLGFRGGGVKIFNMKGEEISQYLPNQLASFLMIDAHKGIWVSTLTNGVFYVHSDKIATFNFNENSILHLCAGPDESVLVSTIDGKTHILNGERYPTINHTNSIPFYTLYRRKQDSIYIVYLDSSDILNSRGRRSSYGITDYSVIDSKPSLVSSRREIFIGQNNMYNGYFLSKRIDHVEWATNGVLFGTFNGLFFLDTLTGLDKQLEHPDLQYRITDIQFGDENYFIGTNGNGLIRYNEHTGAVQKITTLDGLCSNLISRVFPENDSTVWVATNAGLNYVVSRNKRISIKQIRVEDGLPDNDITDVYVRSNDVWIGTRSGLGLLDKNTFEFSKPSLHVYLFWEKVYCNNNLLDEAKLNQLSHDQNNLRVLFHSAYFGGNKKIKYRYKLLRHELDWKYTQQREIILNNLLPGEHQLILQASTNEKDWEENQISLKFKIYAPFYKTLWFYGMCTVAGVLLIYLFFRLRVLIYNRDLVREFLRLIVGKLKPKTNSFIIQTQGKEIRVNSNEVLYTKSIGNYLELYTFEKKYIIRCKTSDFQNLVPDKLEYLRIHRSYIVRIDKISGKSLDKVLINDLEIPIGKTYKDQLSKMEI